MAGESRGLTCRLHPFGQPGPFFRHGRATGSLPASRSGRVNSPLLQFLALARPSGEAQRL